MKNGPVSILKWAMDADLRSVFFLFFHILYESNEKEILRILRIEDALFKHISVY